MCTAQNPLCRTLDRNNGACLTCWPGYIISGITCIVDPQTAAIAASDPYCIKFFNNRCTQCALTYYYSRDTNQCVQIDPLCRNADQDGNCLNCYPGYFLNSGKCIIAQAISISNCNMVTDAGVCV